MTARDRTSGWLVGCGMAALVTLGAAAPAGAQTLGDVARAEAARRQAASAGKLYTNDDLPAVPPAAAPAAAGDAPAQAASTSERADGDGKTNASGDKGGAAGKDDTKKDEAYWRERVKTLREAKARAESFAEALQSRINALSADFVNRDDPAQRNVIAADRQKALDELSRVRKEIQEHTAALDDLQSEARREGVPPGWLR